jgi:GAF domain-containing protein
MSPPTRATERAPSTRSERRLFTVAEMELLYTIANQTAVAIANARLYADQRMKTAAMGRYFQRLARALGATLGPQDVPQMMADLALEVMRGDRCTIYRVGPNHLELAAAAGFRASSRADAELPQTAGLAARIAKQGKPLSSASAPEEPGYREEPWLGRERILSYLGVPMKVGRRTVGVMEIGAQEVRAFTVDEIKLLAQFSRRARVAERLAGRD